MPQTTETEPNLGLDDDPPADPMASTSGYDTASSAASPVQLEKPTRWDQFVLFNVAIPILLLLAGYAIIKLLGVAEAAPMLAQDTSKISVIKSFVPAEVEQVASLAATGRQLELVIDGTVVPYQEARVSSEVAGRVIFKSPKCEAGQIVVAGDVLMQIDPTDYQLEVERLTQLREQEYRALGEIDQEIANSKRLIDVAREDVKLQRREVERQQALKTFASQAELDRAKSALLKSSQELVSWENQVQLLRTRRNKLEASEQLAASQLRLAETNLKRCTVAAQISGVIVSEQADLNTFVNRGTPLFTIEDVSKVEVSASMRMDQLHWVLDQATDSGGSGYDLPDTPAIIEYDVAGRNGTVHRWTGTLVSYDGIGIDPNTRTVPVRLLVDDPTRYVDQQGKVCDADRTNALLRGMFVRVRLQIQPQTDLIVIPGNALRPGNRVWKFSPDPSLYEQRKTELEKKAENQQADSDRKSGPDAESESDGSLKNIAQRDQGDEEDFNPDDWSLGLVQFSRPVYPIDSLQISGEAAADHPSDANVSSALKSPRRSWVCEAGGLDISAGDLVVISQLDSIPSEGLPARAEKTK